MWRKENPYVLLVELYIGTKNGVNLKIRVAYAPAIPLLGICAKDICTPLYTAVWLTVAKTETIKIPLDGWMDKEVEVYKCIEILFRYKKIGTPTIS